MVNTREFNICFWDQENKYDNNDYVKHKANMVKIKSKTPVLYTLLRHTVMKCGHPPLIASVSWCLYPTWLWLHMALTKA